jgi:hypothetical protein
MEHSYKKLYKIMSVMYKWLFVDILCVLFVNVCRHVVYGIVSCLTYLMVSAAVKCLCGVYQTTGGVVSQVCGVVIVCYEIVGRVDSVLHMPVPQSC